MLLGALGRGDPFEHLFDQVDASAWAIELVAQQLVGGAGGGAKTAMHAFAQNVLGRLPIGAAQVGGGELGLHRGAGRVKGGGGVVRRAGMERQALTSPSPTGRG